MQDVSVAKPDVIRVVPTPDPDLDSTPIIVV
jgi:hypothetical protein